MVIRHPVTFALTVVHVATVAVAISPPAPMVVFFAEGSTHLNKVGRELLQMHLSHLRHGPFDRICIFGNTDHEEALRYSPDLSSRRAQAVSVALAEQGFQPRIVVLKGEGESRPQTTDTTQASFNRYAVIEAPCPSYSVEP
jgi:outer membrane protein OmpA-like peptidoglycan-associated protein